MIFFKRVRYLTIKLFVFFTGKSYILFPKGRFITISHDVITGKYVNLNIERKDVCIEIDANVIFQEFCNILVFSKGYLKIHENVFFNNYCSINCLEKIVIGAGTLFGEGVKIYDHNHAYKADDIELKVYVNKFTTGAITIGENCWIGSNVTILKGVNIGDNVIIGANCLIIKSIPSNSIVKANLSLTVETNGVS